MTTKIKILKLTVMKTIQIFKTDALDTVKPATNALHYFNKENSSDDNTIWHNENHTIESNKSAKTEESSNHLEDHENQYKHFF